MARRRFASRRTDLLFVLLATRPVETRRRTTAAAHSLQNTTQLQEHGCNLQLTPVSRPAQTHLLIGCCCTSSPHPLLSLCERAVLCAGALHTYTYTQPLTGVHMHHAPCTVHLALVLSSQSALLVLISALTAHASPTLHYLFKYFLHSLFQLHTVIVLLMLSHYDNN